MRKAIFFDIDGTLWDEYMRIPQSTIEAVGAFQASGGYTFICTGRSRSNIRSKELLEMGFDGIIAACGTHIEFGDAKIFEQLMTSQEVEHALAVIKQYGMSVVLEGPKYTYVDEAAFLDDPYVIHLRKELGEDVKTIEGSKTYEINKLSAVLNGADFNEVKDAFGASFDVIRHSEELLEIVPAGHSKATGIKRVCETLEIAQENTYAFGDSANDIEMLQLVAHGIAMGNGSEAVKEAAEYVTTDIHEDGIYNGLKYYDLI